jgi:hypothetical protein
MARTQVYGGQEADLDNSANGMTQWCIDNGESPEQTRYETLYARMVSTIGSGRGLQEEAESKFWEYHAELLEEGYESYVLDRWQRQAFRPGSLYNRAVAGLRSR